MSPRSRPLSLRAMLHEEVEEPLFQYIFGDIHLLGWTGGVLGRQAGAHLENPTVSSNTPEWGDDARIMLVAQETSALDFFVTDSMTVIGQASGSLVLTGGLDKEIPLGFSPQDFVFEFRRVAFSASSDEQSKSVDWSGEVTKIENQNEERGLGVSKGVGRMARLPPVVSLGINRSPVVRYSEVAPEI